MPPADQEPDTNPYAPPQSAPTRNRPLADETLFAQFYVDADLLRRGVNHYLTTLNNAEGLGAGVFLVFFIPSIVLWSLTHTDASLMVGSLAGIVLGFTARDLWRRKSINRLIAEMQTKAGFAANQQVVIRVGRQRFSVETDQDWQCDKPLAEAETLIGVHRKSQFAVLVIDGFVVLPIPHVGEFGDLAFLEFARAFQRRIELQKPAHPFLATVRSMLVRSST